MLRNKLLNLYNLRTSLNHNIITDAGSLTQILCNINLLHNNHLFLFLCHVLNTIEWTVSISFMDFCVLKCVCFIRSTFFLYLFFCAFHRDLKSVYKCTHIASAVKSIMKLQRKFPDLDNIYFIYIKYLIKNNNCVQM